MALANSIFTSLHDIQTTRFSQLASSAIIIFDHLITLDGEVELIWKSSWSMGKVFFVINRYYTLLSVIVNNYALFSPTLTDAVSLRFFHWQGWTGLIACMIAEVILQMRLYALYFLNKKVLALMVATFIISSASSAAIMATVLRGITATAHPLPGTTFCVPIGVPSYFFAFWLPIILFESLLCGLALFRGIQTFRASGSVFQSGKHLVAILIRDSALYFLMMFATYFTNMLVWASASTNFLEIPIAFSVAFSCCLGNRMIFNVREIHREMKESRRTEDSINHQARQTRSSSFSPAEPLSTIEMGQLRAD
ncbi:hypothetical protein B0H16DRAFT_134691 [Mycena metata]|uniref:DUF6533 domain-containing protein n=1 Tax=Mycena metata TaxID=1033252 RepID=A0AAD7I4K8_9AGAR|nr:hypothetical protein B0H16DRAFT_134691 [Mycena metata]